MIVPLGLRERTAALNSQVQSRSTTGIGGIALVSVKNGLLKPSEFPLRVGKAK
jgi:hypothetical protein